MNAGVTKEGKVFIWGARSGGQGGARTGASESDKEHSFPAEVGRVGDTAPHHRRQELRSGEARMHHSRLARDDRVWKFGIEPFQLVK